ncbi:MAG: PaaI family thioesterase [Gemmatimonadota bacterium]|nr:PaaI family thioesterase [Gemmatimonadota bacterium]
MIHRPGEAVQDHYPEGFAHCYGCGHLNEHGHQIRTFRDGHDTVARFVPQAYHLALPGFVYGGLVASLIDCHGIGTAADAALRAAGREIGDGPTPRYVTAALHVNYLRPTPIGVELELRGHVKHASERKTIVEVTVTAAGVVTAQGEVVAVPMPATMLTDP